MDEAGVHRMAVFATVLVRMNTAAAEPVPRPVQLSAEENGVMIYVIRLLTAKEKAGD